jgi:hypothetical protein
VSWRHVKTTAYNVRATRTDAARWGFWARRARFRSVGAWLASLAVQEVSRREVEAVGFSIRC